MKLLFDENLSPALVVMLATEFPGSAHTELVVGRGMRDEQIWEAAARGDYTIVTKDDDFRSLSFVRGAPPKVIWLSIGNAGTRRIAQLLRDSAPMIHAFGANADSTILVLTPR